jgi:tetratricopeptide (TPR) repeat protein
VGRGVGCERWSGRTLYTVISEDLDRLRAGRADAIRADTKRLLDELGADAVSVLRRVHIRSVDVDSLFDSETKLAVTALRHALADPSQAETAWKILREEGDQIGARRLRRTREDFVRLLESHGLKTVPPGPNLRVNVELDMSKLLLSEAKPDAALMVLSRIEKRFADPDVDAHTRYRFHQQRAAASLQLGRFKEAIQLAQTALYYEPKGVHGLIVMSLASMSLGELADAVRFADMGVAAEPTSSDAWLAKVQVALAAAASSPTVPPEVVSSRGYRVGMANLMLNTGQPERALELTAELMQEGYRTAEVLVCRARALVTNTEGNVTFSEDTALEAERLTSAALDYDTSDDTKIRALVFRAFARRELGKIEEADSDMRLARDLQRDDPQTLFDAAQTVLADDDCESAIRLLMDPLTERFPMLLAMRARAFANREEPDSARRDLEAALHQVNDAHNPDAVRLMAADAALDLGDVDLAERALLGLSTKFTNSVRHLIILARIAFQRGDVVAGTQLFADAAVQDPVSRPGIYLELGSRLLKAGKVAESIDALEKAAPLPAKAIPLYTRALIRGNRLARAQSLVDEHLLKQPQPDWVLDCAAHIAVRRDDPDSAAGFIERIVAGGRATAMARLELVDLLLDIRRRDDALSHLTHLRDNIGSLSPQQRMAMAHLLHRAGESEEALTIAFRAYREADDQSGMHRGLAALALRSRAPIRMPTEVGAGTHVRLMNLRSAEIREHTIYEKRRSIPAMESCFCRPLQRLDSLASELAM